ncbi:hypothetical protein FHS29_003550 [Saccharothrix tamanrassetensis]|uniref:iHD-CE domain-containing protein n=1 Tax=Saccharothrix tamanrassetensis TaxID=1051531 RepID=A0A841CLI3_9PSEU|nr:hypothetical protein [Saccharothrix tamanrassetensis]MBB5956957.1 hypothetical protein [Saccharothrix tamanrassetensis]
MDPTHADLERFCAELKAMWEACGPPVLTSVEKYGGPKKSQVSTILNGDITTVPDIDNVAAILKACLANARAKGLEPPANAEFDYWKGRLGSLTRARSNHSEPGPAGNPWRDLAGTHPVWESTTDREFFRPRVVKAAAHLFDRRRRAATVLAGDDWLDETLAQRMTDRMGDLLTGRLASPAIRFGGVEASLIVLAPLLHQVRVAESAAALIGVRPIELRPSASAGPLRSDYERFLAGSEQSRLVARTELTGVPGRTGAKNEIGWWLFHQWVMRRQDPVPTATAPHDLPIAEEPLRTVLAGTLDRLVKLFHLSPDGLRNKERRNLVHKVSHPSITPALQDVRELLVGLLLVTAHKLAVELTALPSTIVEHLGIPNPVDLGRLRALLTGMTWQPLEVIGIGLYAQCHHEAVLEALLAHVRQTDAVLGSVRDVATDRVHLEPLLRLPPRASADFVTPAPHPDNHTRPAFVVPVTRFRIDETRVRELLMGEQLYSDRSLAIRELYQNALDACRYKQARHRYRAALEDT